MYVQHISVGQIGREADAAIVHLQFGSESVHHLQLTFKRQNGHLLIDQIEVAQQQFLQAGGDPGQITSFF